MRLRNLLQRLPNLPPVVIAFLVVALLPATILTAPQSSKGSDRTAPEASARTEQGEQASDAAKLNAMTERVSAARPLALYYTIDGTFGLDSILEHATDMTILAPQCYWLDQNGKIQGSVPPAVSDAARQAKLPVMALIYNQDFDRRVASLLLRSHHLQSRVIRMLAEIARQENLLGFQLDFENIDPDDINLYTRFVHDAAKEFHRDGRLLSVAVVPRFEDAAAGQWAAAYDYAGLAREADFITLMAYDNSGRLGPPGPIAGYDWVKNALDYAIARVPPDKLLLGIALYGREWTNNGGRTEAHTMPYPRTRALLNSLSLTPQWDEKQRSPWFEYRTGGTVRSVWYENARSVQEKLRLLERYRLRGFAAWRLGMEDPRVWSVISAMQESQPTENGKSEALGF